MYMKKQSNEQDLNKLRNVYPYIMPEPRGPKLLHIRPSSKPYKHKRLGNSETNKTIGEHTEKDI